MAAAQIAWQDYLAEEDVDVPLHALRHSCTKRISLYLNQEVQLRPGMRHTPDYGGLAELIGLDGLEIREVTRRENPGLTVLDFWKEKRTLNPTIGNLVKYLALLGRQDILTDTAEWIRDEIKAHKERLQDLQPQIQDETVSSASAERNANEILTTEDVHGGRTIYDAFICFDCSDIDFVKAMVAKLEGPEFGFRFFIPGRNNLAGTNDNAIITRIISERCRHMIVILSSHFLQSSACEFQTAYAFSLNPGARDKKIVPIKIEECKAPEILKIMAFCDFTNSNLLDWCWKRLATSIMCPMPNSGFLGPQQFVPPPGSCLASGSLGLSDFGGRIAFSNPDSGFSSSNSQSRQCSVTAPIASSHVHQPFTSAGGSHTAPVSNLCPPQAPAPEEKRQKSPSSMSQTFKRFTKNLTPSKVQKKKPKTNEEAFVLE